MRRYLKVSGVAGVLVHHPDIGIAAHGVSKRFVGQKLKSPAPTVPEGVDPRFSGLSLADFYEPCEEIVAASHGIETAIADKELVKVTETRAASHAHAAAALTPKTPAPVVAPKPTARSGEEK